MDSVISDCESSVTSDHPTSDPLLDPFQPCSPEHTLYCATLATGRPRDSDRTLSTAVSDHVIWDYMSDRISDPLSDPILSGNVEHTLPSSASSDRSFEPVNIKPVASYPPSEQLSKSVSVHTSPKRVRSKSNLPPQRKGCAASNVSDHTSDKSVVNPNPIAASDHVSDRLSHNQIPIAKAAANKLESNSTLQTSDNNTSVVEDDVNTPISLEVIREAQNKDDTISTVMQYLKAGVPPNNSDLRNMPEESKVLFAHWD